MKTNATSELKSKIEKIQGRLYTLDSFAYVLMVAAGSETMGICDLTGSLSLLSDNIRDIYNEMTMINDFLYSHPDIID